MIQMNLSQKEIQMELDLRGSEVNMADSSGIKDAAKESSKGQTRMNNAQRKLCEEEIQMELNEPAYQEPAWMLRVVRTKQSGR